MRNSMVYVSICLLALAGLLAGCGRRGPQVYQNLAFTFEIPAGWQLMSDLWPNYAAGRDYYQLGVTEIVMITTARKQGEFGAYFAVASAPLPPDISLEDLFHQAYAPILDQVTDQSEAAVELAGMTGYEMRYRRPWGEPWWWFQDLWLEKDGTVYVLSFHGLTQESFQERSTEILANFHFK